MNCREMLQLVDVLASEKNVAGRHRLRRAEAALASAVKKGLSSPVRTPTSSCMSTA